MQTIKRMLFIAALLSATATASVSAIEAPLRAGTHQQRSATDDYQYGYQRGYIETLQNKCIDGNNFPNNYVRYEQRAELNYYSTIGTPDEDYYRGYLDGMREGFNQPAYCGPTGGGGTGGPYTPPCTICEPTFD